MLLARAIVADPTIILLDEPFNGLDQPNRAALMEIIQWVKGRGVALVISTHDFDLAEQTCDKVALLAGHQVAFGPLQEVFTPELLDRAFGRCLMWVEQIRLLLLDAPVHRRFHPGTVSISPIPYACYLGRGVWGGGRRGESASFWSLMLKPWCIRCFRAWLRGLCLVGWT